MSCSGPPSRFFPTVKLLRKAFPHSRWLARFQEWYFWDRHQ
jgi:hypothetical protein